MNGERFQAAISRIDAANTADPRGIELPYAQRLSDWVNRLAPDASEALQLAARAQHLRRWEIPRDSYPAGRVSYLKWREDLKRFHADQAGAILRTVGYSDELIGRVQDLIRKRNFPRDLEGRVLEDALCLVFLETQLTATTGKTGDEKMIGILRKTWNKMTEQGRVFARQLPLDDAQRQLLDRALKADEP